MRRMREEHEAELATIKTEMEEEKTRLQKAFSEENENTLKRECKITRANSDVTVLQFVTLPLVP